MARASRELRRRGPTRAAPLRRQWVASGEIDPSGSRARYALPATAEHRRVAHARTGVAFPPERRAGAWLEGQERCPTGRRWRSRARADLRPGQREGIDPHWADLDEAELAAGVTSPLRTVLDCARSRCRLTRRWQSPTRPFAPARSMRLSSERAPPDCRARARGLRDGWLHTRTDERPTRWSRCCGRSASRRNCFSRLSSRSRTPGCSPRSIWASEELRLDHRGGGLRDPWNPQGAEARLSAALTLRDLGLDVAAVLLRRRDVRAGVDALGAPLVGRQHSGGTPASPPNAFPRGSLSQWTCSARHQPRVVCSAEPSAWCPT